MKKLFGNKLKAALFGVATFICALLVYGILAVAIKDPTTNHPTIDSSAWVGKKVLANYMYGLRNIGSKAALKAYAYPGTYVLLKRASGEEIYMIDSNEVGVIHKYHVPDWTTFSNFGFTWNMVRLVDDSALDLYQTKGDLTSLIKVIGRPEIYALDQGVKRHIESMASFNAWQFKWNTITFLSPGFSRAIPSSSFISQLAKSPNNPKVYLIENGKRRWITSMNVFKKKGYRWEFVGIVSDGLLNSKPEGPPVR